MPEAMPKPGAPANQGAEIVSALGSRQIVLVGMMGSGKSTVGRRLAARLHVPFVDADHEIEQRHGGMTISEIFAAHGEPYFRDGEARVIAALLENGPQVLATGGGAFLREDTRKRIGDKAVSIWLKAEGDVILRRVKRRADRPLLQTADPAATIEQLITTRNPTYELADIAIWSRDVPHDKIVDEIMDALHAYLQDAPPSSADQSK
ncbi:MAG: shikimate kinase [Bradyrhizobiaceae bacterium]|nr:MAG: shikimate kinase [Bradyrhizobiaceae bacterium]